MDARTAMRVLRRRWWIPALFVVAAAVPTYLISSALPKVYEARTTVLVGLGLPGTSPDYQQLLASQQLSQTYASLVTTGPVLDAVKSDLDLDTTIDALRKSVDATAPVNSTLLTITATDSDPDRAAQIADALAQELISRSPTISSNDPAVERIVNDLLDDNLDSVQQQIASAQAEIAALAGLSSPSPEDTSRLAALRGQLSVLQQAYSTIVGFASGGETSVLTVVDPAQVPTEPTSPRVLLNTAIIALLALVNAIALIFLLEYLDDTLKDPDDVEALTGLPMVGTVEQMPVGPGSSPRTALATVLNPRGTAAEAYRTLRTNLDLVNAHDPIRSILLTSAVAREGTTTTAANLAVAIAQTGTRTILVDADLRNPGVHRMFDVSNVRGLSSLLRTDGPTTVDQVAQPTEEPHLRVITTGPLPADPGQLLASGRMVEVLEALKAQADVVVIDGPPLQGFADASILSTRVDGTIVVLAAGHTRRNAIRGAVKALAARRGRTLGVVLNRLAGVDSSATATSPTPLWDAAGADQAAARGSAPGALQSDAWVVGPSPEDRR